MHIVIADDHQVTLMGLRALLRESGIRHEVIGEATSGPSLLHLLTQCPCDLLITDFSMPMIDEPTDGLALVRQLRQRFPELPVVIITMLSNVSLIKGMLSAGVKSVIEKKSLVDELAAAVRTVQAGGNYVSKRLRDALKQECSSALPFLVKENRSNHLLSPREADVLRMLSCGFSVSSIATNTGRSVKTTSQHKQSAMRKLGVNNEYELFEYIHLSGISSR